MADYGPYTRTQLRTRLAGPGDLYNVPGGEGRPMAETEDGEFCQVGQNMQEALENLIRDLTESGIYDEREDYRCAVCGMGFGVDFARRNRHLFVEHLMNAKPL